MKISFEDGSFLEFKKSLNADKIIVTIAAKDRNNAKSVIVNSVEIKREEFENFYKEINKE